MAGRNFLFVPGPTNIPDRIRRAMDIALEDHRAYDFPEFTKPLFADLKKIFRTETGKVFVFPTSGTGGWEASITNTLSPGDKVLQARFGQFSVLWSDLCTRLGMNVINVDVEWGEGVPLEQYREILGADRAHEIKAVLVTHNETATGVTSDVKGVRRILDELKHPALLYVDGVSSIGCIDFRMDEWGVDLAVAGSQKGLMLPTGLGLVCASEKALEATKTAKCVRCFFDFADQARMNADGWFPYTPAMTLIRGLRESVDMLLEEGLDNVYARHHRYAEAVRRAVDAWGLKLCAKDPKWNSDTVSAILVPEGFNSTDVINMAYRRYNLSLGLGLAKVAGKVFRIGHLGDLNELMVLAALSGAEMAMRDVGIGIEPGSGVGAAQEYLRSTATTR
ncbi:MAG: aminotransferase class V-fold PLP-dependent enzyme [Gammaproteobacteria bacterium]|nr:aminotransferase class V-fold PLP-dependent enzyme [Gammaproteobacteria bacterium]MBI5614842.1 aminotransferase class V-fold PLP-dependent enzyme [Gammaproteobacteria bacterium]